MSKEIKLQGWSAIQSAFLQVDGKDKFYEARTCEPVTRSPSTENIVQSHLDRGRKVASFHMRNLRLIHVNSLGTQVSKVGIHIGCSDEQPCVAVTGYSPRVG